MDLSVVIVAWNTRDLAVSCVALLQQELDELRAKRGISSEIFVVDNGSTDGTVEALRQRFPAIEVIGLLENRGFAAGNNVALERVRGEFVLLLNSDVEVSSASIDRCLGVLQGASSAGAVGPRLLFPDGRTQGSVHGFPGVGNELIPRRCQSRAAGEFNPDASEVVAVNALRGAALFVRLRVIQTVGPLCEEFFFFLEETDWCWRMREAGWDVLFVPDAVATHQLGASSKRVEPMRTRIEFHRSLYRFVELRRGPFSAQAIRVIRFSKALGTALIAAPGALFYTSARRRLRERWGLLHWHLRGCPAEGGLWGYEPEGRRLDAPEQKGEASGSTAKPRPGRLDAR